MIIMEPPTNFSCKTKGEVKMYVEENLKRFLFYPSWAIYLDRKKDREEAKEILWQIMRAGVGMEYDTDNEDIIDYVQYNVMPNVGAAQQRYQNKVENAKTGGRPKDEIDQNTVFEMKLNGATYQDIADFFGVHKNTIQNRMNDWKEEYKNYKNNKNQEQKTETTKTKNNNNKNQEKDIDQDRELEQLFNF